MTVSELKSGTGSGPGAATEKPGAAWLKSGFLSVFVFTAVFVFHGLRTMYGPTDPEAGRWVALPLSFGERFSGYFFEGAIWLGYTYALSAAFAVWAVLQYFSRRASAGAALGSFSLAGALWASACFMVGCCGSPMLGVWVALLGSAAAPWLGPASALLTTVSVLTAGYWMRRRAAVRACCTDACGCGSVKGQ